MKKINDTNHIPFVFLLLVSCLNVQNKNVKNLAILSQRKIENEFFFSQWPTTVDGNFSHFVIAGKPNH